MLITYVIFHTILLISILLSKDLAQKYSLM